MHINFIKLALKLHVITSILLLFVTTITTWIQQSGLTAFPAHDNYVSYNPHRIISRRKQILQWRHWQVAFSVRIPPQGLVLLQKALERYLLVSLRQTTAPNNQSDWRLFWQTTTSNVNSGNEVTSLLIQTAKSLLLEWIL